MGAERQGRQRHVLHSARGLVFIGFTAVAGFYLWTEHRAHLFGAFPYLLFLACPLMHLFMHRGHGSDLARGVTPESPASGQERE